MCNYLIHESSLHSRDIRSFSALNKCTCKTFKLEDLINQLQLFKQQTDLHFGNYDSKTTFSLRYQQNFTASTCTTTINSTKQRIVMRITGSAFAVRSCLIRSTLNMTLTALSRKSINKLRLEATVPVLTINHSCRLSLVIT